MDKVARRLQLLVRLKAADDNGYCSCVSCGSSFYYKDGDGGHFIPRGCSETKLLEENIHPQCKGCNGFGMKFGSAAQNYTIWMQDYYGDEFVNDLLEKHRQKKAVKWKRSELENMLHDINEQIKMHEKRVL